MTGDHMLTGMENFKLIGVAASDSQPRAHFRKRASHAFIFKRTGCSEYAFGAETVRVRAGQMICLPSGSSYTVSKRTEGESSYVALNFSGDPIDRPTVYDAEGLPEYPLICSRLQQMWLMGTAADRYRCHSVFYRVLAFAASAEQAGAGDRERTALIRPAVEYLAEHLFDCELRPGRLHELCGISDTWFRRLFRAVYSATPQEYVTAKRLAHAMELLQGGEADGVASVAVSVGYPDPLYFSRLFTRQYGFPPSRCVGRG